jgi:phasin family protein
MKICALHKSLLADARASPYIRSCCGAAIQAGVPVVRKAAVKGGDGRGKSRSGRTTVPARNEDAPGTKDAPEMTVLTAPSMRGSDEMPPDTTPEAETAAGSAIDMTAEGIPVAGASPVGADAAPSEATAAETVLAAPADVTAIDTIESPVTGTGESTVTDPAANAAFATSTAEPEQPEPAPTNTGSNSTGMEKVMKTTEEFFAFGQGNLEAMIKAGQIWTTGLQDLSKQVAAGAQANLDETMAAFKAMSSAKTLKDAIDMQTGFARASFEKSMTETGKLTDASLKLAEQAMAPITARVTTAMDSFVKAA